MASLDLLGFGPDGWGGLLMTGCALTLAVSASSMLVGLLGGGALAWARLRGPRPIAVVAIGYGVVMRGIPELLVVLLFYFGAPTLLLSGATLLGLASPGLPSPFLIGTMAIGLVSAAYQAEIFRGGIAAVPTGQIEAARAAGFGEFLLFRRVVAPQLFRLTLPAIGNVWQFNLKDSALISVTGLSELIRTSLVAAGSTRHPFLFFSAAMVLYLCLTAATGTIFRVLARRLGRGEGGR